MAIFHYVVRSSSRKFKKVPFSSKPTDRTLRQPNLLFNGYRYVFPQAHSGRDLRLLNHLLAMYKIPKGRATPRLYLYSFMTCKMIPVSLYDTACVSSSVRRQFPILSLSSAQNSTKQSYQAHWRNAKERKE